MAFKEENKGKSSDFLSEEMRKMPGGMALDLQNLTRCYTHRTHFAPDVWSVLGPVNKDEPPLQMQESDEFIICCFDQAKNKWQLAKSAMCLLDSDCGYLRLSVGCTATDAAPTKRCVTPNSLDAFRVVEAAAGKGTAAGGKRHGMSSSMDAETRMALKVATGSSLESLVGGGFDSPHPVGGASLAERPCVSFDMPMTPTSAVRSHGGSLISNLDGAAHHVAGGKLSASLGVLPGRVGAARAEAKATAVKRVSLHETPPPNKPAAPQKPAVVPALTLPTCPPVDLIRICALSSNEARPPPDEAPAPPAVSSDALPAQPDTPPDAPAVPQDRPSPAMRPLNLGSDTLRNSNPRRFSVVIHNHLSSACALLVNGVQVDAESRRGLQDEDSLEIMLFPQKIFGSQAGDSLVQRLHYSFKSNLEVWTPPDDFMFSDVMSDSITSSQTIDMNMSLPKLSAIFSEANDDIREFMSFMSDARAGFHHTIEQSKLEHKMIDTITTTVMNYLTEFGKSTDFNALTLELVKLVQQQEKEKLNMFKESDARCWTPLGQYVNTTIRPLTQTADSVAELRQRVEEKALDSEVDKLKDTMRLFLQFNDRDKVSRMTTVNRHLYQHMAQHVQYLRQGVATLEGCESVLEQLSAQVRKLESNLEDDQRARMKDIISKDVTVPAEKKGYLLLGKKPRWFVVMSGFLSYFKNNEDTTPIGSLDLVLCSIKAMDEASSSKKTAYAFQIISPATTLKLHAMNRRDFDAWVSVIRTNIATRLGMGNAKRSTTTSAGVHAMLAKVSSAPEFVDNPLQNVRNANSANCVCADCGADDPDWACINLGILVCFYCSGVHRSLGTHISKVRSLVLDKWESHQQEIILRLGNKTTNDILTEDLPSFRRLDQRATREQRVKFITDKYVKKSYFQKLRGKSSKELWALVEAGVAPDALAAVLHLLLSGADMNQHHPTLGSLLHLCVASGDEVLLEFLCQWSCDPNQTDSQLRTPLHLAALKGNSRMCRILLEKGASDVALDERGASPLTLWPN